MSEDQNVKKLQEENSLPIEIIKIQKQIINKLVQNFILDESQ